MQIIKLEPHNHGKPQCPDIIKNPSKTSNTEPQAWEHKGNWYYNWKGAMKEAEFLGKEVPTIEQWMEIFESINGDAEEKAKTLNIPMAGFRDAGGGEFHSTADYAFAWSSSPKDDGGARFAILGRGDAWAVRSWNDRVHGMSLRFLAEPNSSESLSLLETSLQLVIKVLERLASEKEGEAGKIREAISLLK